jgi:hypothetical protein
MYPDKFVKTKEDAPTEPHWAIFKFSSVRIPGDERSRTHPGHGYPEHTERYVEYEAYLTKEKWVKAIEEQENPKFGSKEPYLAAKIIPATVTPKTVVEVDEE